MSTKQYRHHVRHWREQWDPKANLIFMKRLKLGLPGTLWVNPGDPVTPEMRELLGTRKLLLWWHARAVGLEEWAIVSEMRPATPSADAPAPPQKAAEELILALGGGWFQVTRPDGTQAKVRGKKKARAFLEA